MTLDKPPPLRSRDSPPHKTARHLARELAVQGMYQWLLNPVDGKQIVSYLEEQQNSNLVDTLRADRTYFHTLLRKSIREAEYLSTKLESCLDRPLDKVTPVERAILLIAACELVFFLEIPTGVIINEAVELTKTFGAEDGFRYVNAIVEKIAQSIRVSGQWTVKSEVSTPTPLGEIGIS